MIDRQHGHLVMCCDTCGEIREAEPGVDACPAFFDAFIEGAKAEGWKPYKVGNEWRHACPECEV